MATAYKISPIADAEIDSAFLLAGLAMPGLDIADWREACARVSSGEEITVAINARGHVQGLAISRATPELELDVSCFVVVSAADAPGVGSELFRYLARRGGMLACRTVRLRFVDRSDQQLPVDSDAALIEALFNDRPAAPR